MTAVQPELVLSPQSLRPGVPFRERAAAAAAAGFRGLSLRAPDHQAARAEGLSGREQLAIVHDLGLEIVEVGFATDWMLRDESAWRQAHVQLWEACDLYRPSYINAGLWTPPDREEAARRLRVLCREAAQRGMAVALEFVPYSGIPTLADAWQIVEGSGCDNAGLVLDLWHAHRSGTSPREVRAIPARSWLAVQLCDAAPQAWPDMREESRHGRLLPGEGCIDIAAYLGALADTGAQPCFAVEVISDELHALDSRECCTRLAAAAATVLRAANCQARLPARHANIIGATT